MNKLIISCIVMALFAGHNRLVAQSRTAVLADATLKLSGTITLDSLTHYIHQQSGIRFSFNSQKVKGSKEINFPAKSYHLKTLLEHLKRTTSLYYSFYNGYVIFQDNPPKLKSSPGNFIITSGRSQLSSDKINTRLSPKKLTSQTAARFNQINHFRNNWTVRSQRIVFNHCQPENCVHDLTIENKRTGMFLNPIIKSDTVVTDSVKRFSVSVSSDTVRGFFINSFSLKHSSSSNSRIDSVVVFEGTEESGQQLSLPSLFDSVADYHSKSAGVYLTADSAQKKNIPANNASLKDKVKANSRPKFFTFRNVRDRSEGFKNNTSYPATPGNYNRRGADIHLGLQWKMPLPIQHFPYLYLGKNGKSQPYQFLVPGIYIKKTIRQKNSLLLELQALQHFYIPEHYLFSSIADASVTDTAKIYSTSYLEKMFGFTAGLQYQRLINNKWLIGMGVNYNIQNKALLHIKQEKLFPVLHPYKDLYQSIDKSNAEWTSINWSFLCLTSGVALQTGKLQIGIQGSLPITSIYNDINLHPLNAQLFCRWQLTK